MGATISTLYAKMIGNREIVVLMTGTDAVGKTIILYKLKLGKVVTTISTIGFNLETVKYKKTNFVIYDINGQIKFRQAMRNYYKYVQAVILVLNSSNRECMWDTEGELSSLMHHVDLKDAPILIMANKNDLPDVMSTSETVDQLKLNTNYSHRTWHVQETSEFIGYGLYEGLEWIHNALSKQ